MSAVLKSSGLCSCGGSETEPGLLRLPRCIWSTAFYYFCVLLPTRSLLCFLGPPRTGWCSRSCGSPRSCCKSMSNSVRFNNIQHIKNGWHQRCKITYDEKYRLNIITWFTAVTCVSFARELMESQVPGVSRACSGRRETRVREASLDPRVPLVYRLVLHSFVIR